MSQLDSDRAELLAHDAERTGATVSLAHWADGATAAPARRLTCAPVSATTVTARLAGRLELDVAGLALGLVDRLRRTAAFANPMFFERERARLSTHKTPRVHRLPRAVRRQAAAAARVPRRRAQRARRGRRHTGHRGRPRRG